MKIEINHLTKKYPNLNKKIHEDVIALNDFTLEIPDGQLIGLLGPSGCGKSTTLNLISGLEKATSGSIFFGDTDVTNLPPESRGVGLVFQNYALYPHLTVLQNIMFPLENLRGPDKLTKEEMVAKATEAAKLTHIENLFDRKPRNMSGGQQQRVAIARALVKRPKVLLLDEPLSNLDARLRLQMREEIKRVQRETGITTVFVTHDQDEAMSITDMIVVMSEGMIQQKGKPQEVYDNPKNLFVSKFLGTPPINVFDGTVSGGIIRVGEKRVMKTDYTGEMEVKIGIRPEGLIPEAGGPLECNLKGIEVLGRDTIVVASHALSENASIRSIVRSEVNVDSSAATVRFGFQPRKVYVFDAKTGDRINCTVSELRD